MQSVSAMDTPGPVADFTFSQVKRYFQKILKLFLPNIYAVGNMVVVAKHGGNASRPVSDTRGITRKDFIMKTARISLSNRPLSPFALRALHLAEEGSLKFEMVSTLKGGIPAAFAESITGSKLRPSELGRRKCVWEALQDGYAAPATGDYHGIASTLREAFKKATPEKPLHLAVQVRPEHPVMLREGILGGIEGAFVTQRADGTIRVAGEVASSKDASMLLISAQALCVLAACTDGDPEDWEVSAALAGDLRHIHGNYRPCKAGVPTLRY